MAKLTIAMIKATMKTIFAMPAALAAIPKKPKNAAINAMTKKVSAQENMESSYARAYCAIHAESVHDTLPSGLRRKR
jgi:hypothetical protein